METITEKRPAVVVAENEVIAQTVATEIADLIQTRNAAGLTTVLGLATGKTPILLYQHLIRIARERALDFSHVLTFNLDEYYPMESASPQSYHSFMYEHLFRHIPLAITHTHVPDGALARENITSYCAEYEQKIQQAGGITIQILGIGENGHIGFNEPGVELVSRTRMVTLSATTIHNAADDFGGEANVPREALTMGIATILEAQKVVLLASGSKKARAVQQTLDGSVSANVPASYLRLHPDATVYLDPAAAAQIN